MGPRRSVFPGHGAGILGSLSGLSPSYWAMVAADTQAIPLMRQAANGGT